MTQAVILIAVRKGSAKFSFSKHVQELWQQEPRGLIRSACTVRANQQLIAMDLVSHPSVLLFVSHLPQTINTEKELNMVMETQLFKNELEF